MFDFWKPKYALFIFAAFLLSSHSAFAACTAICQSVVETTKLTFPTLQKPASGSRTYTIPPDGGAASGTATVLYGTGTRGAYIYTSRFATTDCLTTYYTVANVSSGNAGVTYSAWKIYTDSTQTLPHGTSGTFPAPTGSTYYIGATITITSTATTGSFSPSYDLTCEIL